MGCPSFLYRWYRKVFWSHPAAYSLLAFTSGARVVLDSRYDVWVDGYPRSGNTYARNAMELCLRPDQKLASHRHSPAFILRALELKRPGMLLVREPQDVVVSNSIYTGRSLRHEIERFIDFYATLYPFRRQLFVVRFKELINDFSSIIDRWSSRYGVDCGSLKSITDFEKRIMDRINMDYKRQHGTVDERIISRPSEKRKLLKQTLVRELSSNGEVVPALSAAENLYRMFSPD